MHKAEARLVLPGPCPPGRSAPQDNGLRGSRERPTLLSHGPHPCCRPRASPSPDQGPVLWVLTGCQDPSQVGPGREKDEGLRGLGDPTSPISSPSHRAHLKSAPRLGHSTAEDLPHGPVPSRPPAPTYLEVLLPVNPLVRVFKFFVDPGALPTGRGQEQGETWPEGEFGGRPLFLGHPRDPLACRRLSSTALSPGDSVAWGGGCCFHPGPPFPVLPGANLLWARSLSLGQRPPAAERMLEVSSWLHPTPDIAGN